MLLPQTVKLWTVMATLTLIAPQQSATAQPAQDVRPEGERRAELGQFMTPEPIADFMAAQFDPVDTGHVILLDAGAGQGALSMAFERNWSRQSESRSRLEIDAFEIDP